MEEKQDNHLITEPSVWDYFVGKLNFLMKAPSDKETPEEKGTQENGSSFPWLTSAALALALLAQLLLEPTPERTPWPGIIFYTSALVCLVIAWIRKEWQLPVLKPDTDSKLNLRFRMEFLILGVFLALFAFLLFGNGKFGLFNTFLWISSVVLIVIAFWKPVTNRPLFLKSFLHRFWKAGWQLKLSWWTVIALAVIAVILFFNFYRLNSVPPEMVSDQAEKLLDIHDILQGHTPVYFPRNTGREGLHFYLAAATMAVFNLNVSFLNLKIVAVLANLLTLFFIYMLGKEFANKWVGLSAALFAGFAYWPLLFTRLALRIPYYPLFVAPVLYFMLRGLRKQSINDILLAGFFLGLGLHGYTPFRIVPILVVFGIIIYLLHQPGKNRKVETVYSLILITFVSMIVFIPLFRYWLANPDMFAYRAFSRLTGMEVGFQNQPLLIFFQNFWKSSMMFFWDNGVIWAHSVPGRPALEVVSGALYFLGIVSLLIRYFRKKSWMDLFLLVSIPILMMPSILSLAYPGENPSLNRTAGAIVPVFLVIGLAFETIIRSIRKGLPKKIGKAAAILVVALLVLWSAGNNYDLVFNQYYNIYQASSWNTSEIGRVAAMFIESMGSPDTTYVVGYPHWVDSRLVAINAGYTGRDFAIFPEQITETALDPRPKMFFLNIGDTTNIQLLADTFDNGVLSQYDSEVENKDFMVFFVPPLQGESP